MNTQELHALSLKYVNGSMSKEELHLFKLAIHNEALQAEWEQIIDTLLLESSNTAHAGTTALELFEDFKKKTGLETIAPTSKSNYVIGWQKVAAAIVIGVLVIAGGIWLINKPAKAIVAQTPKTINVMPAKQGAILTLSDGAEIVLDGLPNGFYQNQSNAKIILMNGQLAYEKVGGALAQEATPAYNTLSTPKGKQFNISLQDGTKIYLNAASTLKYPTAFPGKERVVEITGEAYFEIAKDAKKPFKVLVNGGAEVEVLGTSFNVYSYTEEKKSTITLIDGGVNVKRGSWQSKLFPGEQSIVSEQTNLVQLADISKVMAWKQGIFNFEGVGLAEMMRQLERWYNIEVQYEGSVPEVNFFGKMSRNVELATVLNALKGFGLKFEIINNKTIVVKP